MLLGFEPFAPFCASTTAVKSSKPRKTPRVLRKLYSFRPYGQVVKTSPFHGGNPSSNLGRVTKKITAQAVILFGSIAQLVRAPALQAGGHRFKSYYFHQKVHCLVDFFDVTGLKGGVATQRLCLRLETSGRQPATKRKK